MDELIRRQDAINVIMGQPPEPHYPSWYAEQIKLLPPAPQRTGRWEYVDYGGFGNYHCSACRMICICNGDYDYCPNCGARMEYGEEM